MATIIGTNAGVSIRSLHGRTQFITTGGSIGGSTGGGTVSDSDSLNIMKDIYRYQILYKNVILVLDSYLRYFTLGDYTNLKNSMTQTMINTLTILLSDSTIYYNQNVDNLSMFIYDKYTFEKYRNNTTYILNGIIQALLQFDKVDQLTNEVASYKEILKDDTSIINYLNSHRELSQIAFSSSQTFNTNIVLKPWYKRYIMDYGPPNTGIFETDKMAIVVQSLIDEGEITMEEFLTAG
jgi:hypothetical protein